MFKDKKTWLRGFGVGLIAAAIFFYGMLIFTGYNHPEKTFERYVITDDEVISRARELGMVFITDLFESDDNLEDMENDEQTTE